MRKSTLIFAATTMVWSVPASAGTFASGYGETIPEAIDSALKVAEAAVKSKGKGCIKPYNGEIIRIVGKTEVAGTTVWHVTAHYANQAGSCGQYSRDQKWLQDTAARLMK